MAFRKKFPPIKIFEFPLGFPGLPPAISYFLIFEWILQTNRAENGTIDRARGAEWIYFWNKLGSYRNKIFIRV
jgi:hypothetical protein